MKKKVCTLALMTMVICSLSGCKKSNEPTKEDLQNQVNSLSGTVVSQSTEITSLKQLLSTYNPSLAEVQNLDKALQLATGENAYVQLNDRIFITNDVVVEPSTSIQNQTVLSITDDVKFVPTSNWSIQVGSGSMKMNHTNGVYGEISCYKYVGDMNGYTCFQQFVEPHLQAIKAEAIGGSQLIFFADGTRAGAKQTSRIKVAKMKSGENYIEEEIMTQPYETDEYGRVVIYGDDGEAQIYETDENGETIPVETDENGNVVESSSAEESSSTEDTSAEESSEVETDENGETVESGEDQIYQAGELTDEVLKQDEEETYSVDNYVYTVGCASYSLDQFNSVIVVFKFFYKEGDVIDASSKEEFVDSTIKSIAINNNYLTLQ